MTPLEYLREEFDGVKRALGETLRHDYGPARGRDYYNECGARLEKIKAAISGIGTTDFQTIST
jgi:hypothetical protein